MQNDLITKIKSNIKSHEQELTLVMKQLELKKLVPNKDMKLAAELLVLKDKVNFHKTCILCLKDLLNET